MANWKREDRGARVLGAIAVAAIAAVAFASLGGASLAQSAIGLAQNQYGKKVTICHKGKRTIRISVRAWPAHQRHGDVQGPCATVKRHGHHGEHHQGSTEHGSTEHGKQHQGTSGHGALQGTTVVVAKGHGTGDSGKGHGQGHDK